MKRSEAIDKIADTLYELNLDSEEAQQEAEKLLSKLEAAGLHSQDPKLLGFKGEWDNEDD